MFPPGQNVCDIQFIYNKNILLNIITTMFLLPLQCNYRVGDVRVIINSLEMYLINFHSYFPIFMNNTFYQLLNISK